MFDMSWGEVMLIGGVALIVIGPKDLPKALRTVGQVTGKMRRMAGEFHAQFNEAIREAEFDEVRREVDGIKRSASTMGPSFNPVQTIRDEIRGAVDGRSQSSTQPLANVAAKLAENDPPAPSEPSIQAPALAEPANVEPPPPPDYALPDLPPRTTVAPTEPSTKLTEPGATS
ncbi:Sec-independent protein translocase protein TatB [Methylobacterium sp. E-045]|uniref:Sec-independent protein translocase protein TatB n=1 Tax=Methylobacterium sp. E-045 TaxID=2836575 RepID=UPI001FB907D8|nr:Sec-independent protein translocase protein TatB [Methylobacterium sp. E-045]MCJ2128846.1 Sec-independent protein translocase protein TatB [Methylobacterium sp. E-045]